MSLTDFPVTTRILLLVGVAAGAHVLVALVRTGGQRLMSASLQPRLRKAQSIISLLTSVLIFSIYFAALGFILRELGVSLTAYLASASVIGLAVGFGSQGLVQDVVTGMTLVFADLFDVGEMVEIGGQAGIVRTIGMRFVVLENSFGAEVFIPNRSITNVINYPRGYVRCIADLTLTGDEGQRKRMEELLLGIADAIHEQFPGILLTAPSPEGRLVLSSGREFLRIKFRIWPGRGQPIEITFRDEAVRALRELDATYDNTRVAIYYEVEKRRAPVRASTWFARRS